MPSRPRSRSRARDAVGEGPAARGARARSTAIRPAIRHAASADALRAAIQRQLLAGAAARRLPRRTAPLGAARPRNEMPEVPVHQLRRQRALPQLRLRVLARRSTRRARSADPGPTSRRPIGRSPTARSRRRRSRRSTPPLDPTRRSRRRAPRRSRRSTCRSSTTRGDDVAAGQRAAVPRPPLAVRDAAPRPAARRAPHASEEPALDLGARRRAPAPGAAVDGCRRRRRTWSTRRADRARRRAAAGAASIDALHPRRASTPRAVFHAAALRPAVRADRSAAGRAAAGVPAAALNGGYLDDVHRRRRPDDRQDGRAASAVVPADRRPTRPSAVPFGRRWSAPRLSSCRSLPAGVGFLPALFRADGRALHDRLADTRVVKRDPPRRLPRHRRLLRLFPDRARHGRLRRRPGRLPAGLVDAVAASSRSA